MVFDGLEVQFCCGAIMGENCWESLLDWPGMLESFICWEIRSGIHLPAVPLCAGGSQSFCWVWSCAKCRGKGKPPELLLGEPSLPNGEMCEGVGEAAHWELHKSVLGWTQRGSLGKELQTSLRAGWDSSTLRAWQQCWWGMTNEDPVPAFFSYFKFLGGWNILTAIPASCNSINSWRICHTGIQEWVICSVVSQSRSSSRQCQAFTAFVSQSVKPNNELIILSIYRYIFSNLNFDIYNILSGLFTPECSRADGRWFYSLPFHPGCICQQPLPHHWHRGAR